MFSRRAHLETFAHVLGLHVLSAFAWFGYFPETTSSEDTTVDSSTSARGSVSRNSHDSSSDSDAYADADAPKENSYDVYNETPPSAEASSNASASTTTAKASATISSESKKVSLKPSLTPLRSKKNFGAHGSRRDLLRSRRNSFCVSALSLPASSPLSLRSSEFMSAHAPTHANARDLSQAFVASVFADDRTLNSPTSSSPRKSRRHTSASIQPAHDRNLCDDGYKKLCTPQLSRKCNREHALKSPLRAVVFGGGGARGWAFIGALETMYKLGIDWGARKPALEEAAGTSVGCIPALAIVLGFSFPELLSFSSRTDEMRLLSMNAALLLTRNALNDGTAMREHISSMLVQKLRVKDISLGGLRLRTGMNLRVATYDLTHGRVLHLSGTDTPHISTVDAVFASLAVPLLFAPVTLRVLPPSAEDSTDVNPELQTSIASSTFVQFAANRGPIKDINLDLDEDHAAFSVAAPTRECMSASMSANSTRGSGRDRLASAVATASVASSSFVPVVCVDGGLGDSLSVRAYAPGAAIAFRLDWEMPAVGVGELNSLYSLAMRGCIAAMYESARLEMRSFDGVTRAHIVSLGTGASSLISSTPEEALRARTILYERGRDAVAEQLTDNSVLLTKLRQASGLRIWTK